MTTLTFVHGSDWYSKMIRASIKLLPFYQYYFDFYLPQKKVVILSMFTKLSFYDEHLYTNFAKNLDNVIFNTTDPNSNVSINKS